MCNRSLLTRKYNDVVNGQGKIVILVSIVYSGIQLFRDIVYGLRGITIIPKFLLYFCISYLVYCFYIPCFCGQFSY